MPAVDACRGGVRITTPPGISLDLSFMTPGTLDARLTFTRASTATYVDVTGTVQTAAVNAPRWEYSSGVLRGLLLEEARTNVLLNSATLGTQSVTVTAVAYTLSFYGTGTVTKSGTATGALAGTGASQRVSQTFTPTAGTLTLTVTGTVTNAQLEAGAFPTSYIPTTAVSVTRAADLCRIPSANMGWFTSPGGTWSAEFININTTTGNNLRIIGQPLQSAIAPLYREPSASFLAQYDGSAVLTTVNAISPNVVTKAASTWAPGNAKMCLNGAVPNSTPGLSIGYASMATNGVAFMITNVVDQTENMSGYMRRMRYWPRALSDAELQSATT
jgi:hypothetical protein